MKCKDISGDIDEASRSSLERLLETLCDDVA